MENFQLDKLVVNKNAYGKYDLSGTFNLDITTPPTAVAAADIPYIDNNSSLDLDKMMFVDVKDNRTKRVTFSYPNLVFNDDYGRQDYLSIIVNDTTPYYKLDVEVAGIAVKDTDYPPPTRGTIFKSMSAAPLAATFIVQKIELSRHLNTTYFEIRIDLNYSGAKYAAVDYALVSDYTRRDLSVLAIQVAPDPGAPASGTLNFPAPVYSPIMANLSLVRDRGLPIIVTEDPLTGINWDNVNIKKALLFIDTPTIIRI